MRQSLLIQASILAVLLNTCAAPGVRHRLPEQNSTSSIRASREKLTKLDQVRVIVAVGCAVDGSILPIEDNLRVS